MQLAFIRNDATAAPSTPATGPSTPPPPILMPTTWLPNAFGLVLRRTSDQRYIRLTFDFALNRFLLDDLGASAPSATNYDTYSQDGEWTSPYESFGFYDGSSAPVLILLDPADPIPNSIRGGYSAAKGMLFASGYGPILRSGDGQRIKLSIDAQNQIVFSTP